MRIAVDAFGGDNAPAAVVEGCIDALKKYPDMSVTLCGDEKRIKAELEKYRYDVARVDILHAPEIISCDEQPTFAIRKKKDSSLVKAMEEQGIGRPSTYAPTITTILARRYIVKEAKNLYVTELGEAVNNIMKTAFPSIVDVSFTANMESLLDSVEEGGVNWKVVVSNFYPDLHEAVEKAEKEQAGQVRRSEETDTRQRRQDASEKGKNEYFGDGGRRRKKNEIPPEGRVIRGKGNGSHFDCSI